MSVNHLVRSVEALAVALPSPTPLSHDTGQGCPHVGLRWTAARAPCHASVMSTAGIALVSRRHVDLGRMSSAICRAGC
ncbi:putative leader peptide [Streptomyces albidoflavus]|uniref:putative leader peptide n=1 Tax=Streptomyces albidoflavus TaxID=1886 RepID=UPI003407CF9E